MAKKTARKAVKKSAAALDAARASAKVRATALVARSAQAQASRQKNVAAGTPRQRIKGHLSQSGRVAQAKRDSKQRGE